MGVRGAPEAGAPDGRGLRIGIVASRYNDAVTSRLVLSALASLVRHGVLESDIETVWVPGAVEIPLMAQAMARGEGSARVDTILALGAVIRGDTPHFDYVCRMVADGVMRVMLDTGVPIVFGVLTAETEAQAIERAGGEAGDKGWEAAVTGVTMARLLAERRARMGLHGA